VVAVVAPSCAPKLPLWAAAASTEVAAPEAVQPVKLPVSKPPLTTGLVLGAVTVRLTVAVWVLLPPVPVTVMVEVPVAAEAATVMVIVELPEPGAAIEVGLKATVTPVGWPEAESATAELKPPATVVVMVTLPAVPWVIVAEVGDAAMVKSGLVTVRVTVAVCVVLPPVPVTVMG
jgi:hypothetical protein